MRRFDENATLDRLAVIGQIDDALADELGRTVAAAHETSPCVDSELWIAALGNFLTQNDAAFRSMRDVFPIEQVIELDQASRETLTRLRPLILKRGQNGFVRRCHGDLHLGNIAMIGGKPVMFDAIEFDPQVAAGDVLYDLAFLLIDLFGRGLHNAANIVFNRYLTEAKRSENLDGLAALPLYLSLRAAIRAKVTAARLQQADTDCQLITDNARGYFRLAAQAIQPATSTLIAIGGLSGTGKSVLASALAPHVSPIPGAVLLRSDVERKTIQGIRENERLSPSAYTAEASARTYEALAQKARRVLSAGHSVIVDAVFGQLKQRNDIEAIARSCKTSFHGFFLVADLATRTRRVGARAIGASDADQAVARAQEKYDLGAIDWTYLNASGELENLITHTRDALSTRGHIASPNFLG